MSKPVDHKKQLLKRLKQGNNSETLRYASENHCLDTALDSEGNTVFHLAAKEGNIAFFTEFADKTDCDQIEIIFKSLEVNRQGQTPWHIAAAHAQTEFFKQSTLLNVMQKAWQDKVDKAGNLPIHYAVQYQRADSAEFKLNKKAITKALRDLDTGKASLNWSNDKRKTPLMLAVECGALATVEKLIRLPSVDLNAMDINGDSVLDLTLARGNLDTTSLKAFSTEENLVRHQKEAQDMTPVCVMAKNPQYNDEEFIACLSKSFNAGVNADILDRAISTRALEEKAYYKKRYLKDSILSVFCPAATIAVAFEFLPFGFLIVPAVFAVTAAGFAFARYQSSMIEYKETYEENLRLQLKVKQATAELNRIEERYEAILSQISTLKKPNGKKTETNEAKLEELRTEMRQLSEQLKNALKYEATCMSKQKFKALKIQALDDRVDLSAYASQRGRRLAKANFGADTLCSAGAGVSVATSVLTTLAATVPAMKTALAVGLTVASVTFPPSLFFAAGIIATIAVAVGTAALLKNTMYKSEKSTTGEGNKRLLESLGALKSLRARKARITERGQVLTFDIGGMRK